MNWTELINDLVATGLSQKAIGDAVDCSQNAIWNLQKGNTSDPAHSTGEKLIALHEKHVPKPEPAHVA